MRKTDSEFLRHINAQLQGDTIFNAGTSEGVRKAWETRKAGLGDRVKVSGGSGLDSGKEGVVVHSREVKTDGRGVPTNIKGAYKPVDHTREHVIRHPINMKLPTTPNFKSTTIFDGTADETLSNRSVWPTLFDTIANKKLPDSLQKANACRKGARALDELKNGAPPIGFTGHVHPLSEQAESSTKAALASDHPDDHDEAADHHDAAATKMASFMKETSPRKHKDHSHKINGLTATREHHIKRTVAHRHRAVYLRDKQDKEEAAASKEKEAKKKDKK